MTIREIEEQLGIPRATVRYYEREGLLAPVRGGNNYRDYTEEDLNTLEKIRLLRRLDMPLDTIKAVQRGEVPLREALERQEKLLEDGAERQRQATELCRSLLRDGVTYPELDAGRYREEPALPQEAPAEENDGSPAETPPTPPVRPWLREPPPLPEGAVKAFNPWQRFWARSLDMVLAELVVITVLALVFHVSVITNDSALFSIGTTILIWLVVLAVEPLLLATWGNTPGKWLLGLKLEDYFGRKLTWGAGFIRCCGVLVTGYGLYIPIYSIWRHWKCYKACRDWQNLSYDEENRYYSRVGDRWCWRAVGSILVSLVLMAAAVLVSFQTILPPNRGDLTREEFYDNVAVLSGNDFWSGRSLDGGSMWIDEEGYLLHDKQYSYAVDSQGREISYGDRLEDKPLYTLETDENGHVTAVNLDWRRELRTGGVFLPAQRAQLAVGAILGSREGPFALLRSPLLSAVSVGSFNWFGNGQSMSWEDDGWTMTACLTWENCIITNIGMVVMEEDAEEGTCHFTFRLEKTE